MNEAVFWSLPPRPNAVSDSRDRVRSSCPHLPPGVLNDALLLTSELVTNAVRHGGGGDISCRLWPGQRVVRLEVADGNGTLPREVDRGLVADSGRGLHIVDTLASRWGSTPGQRESGKTVWFELDTGLG
jgi:two-component sensor histidine kinase